MSIGTSEISGPQNASGERGNEIVLRGAGAILYKCRDEEVLLEGRAGTGKTVSACKKMVDCAFSFPGANILCARQTRESMTDSILITLESVIGEHHPEVTRMSRSNRHAYQLNGSQIVCAGLDEPAKAFGTGWDLIYVNEAIETSLNSWELFARAGRNPRIARKAATPRMPYRQRIADLNPGAPTHWANKRATRAGNELRAVVTFDDWLRLDEYNSGPQDGMMRRLISVHQDNPAFFNIDPAIWQWTEEGVDYRERKLSKMTGHRKMRMLHGIWCAAEGSVYPAFSEQDNTCPWFAVPADWPLYWGTDPGFDHPCAMLWFAVAPNGKSSSCMRSSRAAKASMNTPGPSARSSGDSDGTSVRSIDTETRSTHSAARHKAKRRSRNSGRMNGSRCIRGRAPATTWTAWWTRFASGSTIAAWSCSTHARRRSRRCNRGASRAMRMGRRRTAHRGRTSTRRSSKIRTT